MAGSRAARALRLFRRHRQQLWLAPLPEPSRQSMAWHTEAAQPKATTVVGSLQRSSARQPSAAAPARSHLARASDLKREYSSEEPDAGKLQVRICGGGGGRPPPLPDQCPGAAFAALAAPTAPRGAQARQRPSTPGAESRRPHVV